MKRLFFYLIIFIFCSAPLLSAERMRVAVLELKAEGVSKKNAKVISNMLRTDLINLNRFTVIERTQMNEILREQGFQQTGCTDQECAVQMGRLMAANMILVGEVSSIGKAISITVRIVDVEKGASKYAAREKAQSMDVIDIAISRLSAKLSAKIDEAAAVENITPVGYYVRGIIPGWGQHYSGHKTKGYIYMGLFIGSGAFMGYSIYNFMDKRAAYEDADTDTDKKYEESEKALTMEIIAVGVFSAVYIINWIDIIFFSKPDFSRIAMRPGKMIESEMNYFSFNVYNTSDYYCETYIDIRMGYRF